MSETTTKTEYDEVLAQRLLHQRVLLMGTALDEQLGNRLCSALLVLAAEDPHRDITLLINSPGGSVPAMLAIRDVMNLVPCDVATIAIGWAASAGQFLLSSGARGKRAALPHARVLLHQGSAGIGGTAVDVELQADDLRHTRDTVLGLIAQDTGQPVERVTEDSQRDRWFTADEALAYGFVDRVVDDVAQVLPWFGTPTGFGAPSVAPGAGGAR
ncbi:ClpP family protease [Cellulomonas persica]|uniref:ATP-dependent Clp protease proteolytic subunit n=1 Tax=Cellulomonas persica TaxID=76861 RepID=A0A510USN2_9CELL|nr:ATP-dependent Clp protease proteolytic subunit [Cellulomonas persica]GEK17476.1 ATP-dependent Clp protease proteolytic subunit 3 [Cellulomonas persica]